MHGIFNIFAEQRLYEYLEYNNQGIRDHIKKESENYILNVNETEYIKYLVGKFKIEMLRFDFENKYIDSYEKEIPVSRSPFEFDSYSEKTYPKQIIVYHVPFTGNHDLLRCKPNKRLLWTKKVYIKDRHLCFEVINFNNNSEEIKNEANHIIKTIEKQARNVEEQVEEHNNQLKRNIEQIFQARKQKILNKNSLMASLGVPIKKRKEIPETYSIPVPEMRKKVTVKPEVTENGYKTEPKLDDKTYSDILQTLYDGGKVFERCPSTYVNKSEEELRDHLLFHIQPQFEGSVTGETFNKSGKTDILIRYENSNVFIGECKFWKGKKSYLDTITQLLKYLTWRDSKAAVIVFVNNKEISSVLKTVKEVTSEHSNYIGHVNDETESWFNYRFHINNDPNREVKLAVLLFHIPN